MCLAIYKPAGAEVSEEHLRNGYANHSDGAGFAWSQDGQLHVVKGIFDVEKVIEQYNKIKQYACLIHFRKATHGKIDKTNCHPFLFNDGKLALIHNGVLPIKCTIDGLSDTAHYVKLVLEPMVKRNGVPINDGALQYLLATSIGSDKMAIMDCDGNTYVINEDKGTWEGGVWYSNSSFQYAYSRQTHTTHNAAQTYLARKNRNGSSDGSSDSYRNNWRKRFDESPEGDDAYLEFWKRVASNSDFETEGTCCSLKETQKISTSRDTVDDAGNVKEIIDVEELEEQTEAEEEQFGPGMMCDYGWWDEEIEADIETIRKATGCDRKTAIIRVFNPR